MECFYHPERDAVNTCSKCGRPVCNECNYVTGTHPICRNCWDKQSSARKGAVSGGVVENMMSMKTAERREWKTGSTVRKREFGRITNISKLPKVSDSFVTHIREHVLQGNEWMPCPRCGAGAVDPPSGAKIGALAGFSMSGCLIMVIASVVIWCIILSIFFLPLAPLFIFIAVVFIIAGIFSFPLWPVIGAAMGIAYRCKSCGYAWAFKDVANYKDSLRN